jgi:hypothetical protein
VTCRTRYLSVRQACRTWNQAAVQDKKPSRQMRRTWNQEMGSELLPTPPPPPSNCVVASMSCTLPIPILFCLNLLN